MVATCRALGLLNAASSTQPLGQRALQAEADEVARAAQAAASAAGAAQLGGQAGPQVAGGAAGKGAYPTGAVLPLPSSAARAGQSGREGAEPEELSCEYQDTSQPLPTIAARLSNHLAALARHPAAAAQRRERVLHASFVTDFGLEHGLPEAADATSQGACEMARCCALRLPCCARRRRQRRAPARVAAY